jgi:heparosan-N-sulfate-glucuronate 5-epimerase
VRAVRRPPQLRVTFESSRPLGSYYNDLRRIALDHGDPAAARLAVTRMTSDRVNTNPVSVAQLGLGAWQLRELDSAWLEVMREAASWTLAAQDEGGRLQYLFPIGHTYALEPPWPSAMAQGQAVSLLLRASLAFAEPAFAEGAARAAASLTDPDSSLVAVTESGPVLQEYPTDPPAHVLNGWIFALLGLHDLAAGDVELPGDDRARAAESFAAGCQALARRLPLYRTWPNWSRYDLFPHPLVHVASPFYHRLHIELLGAISQLSPSSSITETISVWEDGSRSDLATAAAVARKVAFRAVRPRSL